MDEEFLGGKFCLIYVLNCISVSNFPTKDYIRRLFSDYLHGNSVKSTERQFQGLDSLKEILMKYFQGKKKPGDKKGTKTAKQKSGCKSKPEF